MKTAVIVVAAGSGIRLGAGVPKAFVELDGQSLLQRTLHTLQSVPSPLQVVVVAPETHLKQAHELASQAAAESELEICVVTGGATRHDSVQHGLAVVHESVDVVLVHDAARALAPATVFADVEMAVRATNAGIIPAVQVLDSLKQVDASGGVVGVVERSALRAAQTPQGFPKEDLIAAYAAAESSEYTDDAAVFAANGGAVTTIVGDEVAFKITTAHDLARASHILGVLPESLRVGTGMDTHAFGEAEGMWLAGLYWPEEKELAGHSDGDAVAHAICDALLSAAGLGDIGSRFGTDDPAFENARGEVFVRGAVELLAEHGFSPVNVAAQVIGNRPRFSPRRREAEQLVSSWVGAPVSLSATTTDGLGFTGKGEGIAVSATALVRQS